MNQNIVNISSPIEKEFSLCFHDYDLCYEIFHADSSILVNQDLFKVCEYKFQFFHPRDLKVSSKSEQIYSI